MRANLLTSIAQIDIKPLARWTIVLGLFAIYYVVITMDQPNETLAQDLKEMMLVVLSYYMGKESK